MSTARCYTCHTLRPLSDFSYRRKDGAVSATSQFRRYLCVLMRRVDTKSGNGGVIYRYRCVHPRHGDCPKAATVLRRQDSSAHIQVREEAEEAIRLDHRALGDEARREDIRDVEVEIEVCEDPEGEFRAQKEDAIKRLRQCVGTAESPAISP
jgi:hypothetical protein